MIVQSLDGSGKYQYIFGSEFTVNHIKEGEFYARDLTHFNRSLNQVVVLDYSKDHYHLHPNNVVVIPTFDGESNDQDLVKATYLLYCKNIFSNFLDFFSGLIKDRFVEEGCY